MARISKRKAAKGMRADVPVNTRKVYKVAIYARLSSDSKENASESIEGQVALAENFIQEFNLKHTEEQMEVFDIYRDLGKTGTNFERDGFQRMMQDVRLGDVDCVVVKDLSRFGRNYLDAGNYIEKIFPFLGVRFIAVSDGYDTGAEGNAARQMASEIKNLVNDMYSRDFSKKLKVSHAQRQQSGDYVGGYAPYGYRSVHENGSRWLEPDEREAEIVRFIFETFAETKCYAEVIRRLHGKRINPPGKYRVSGELYFQEGENGRKWSQIQVKNILTSETYIGNLLMGKTKCRVIRAHGERQPEDRWIRHDNRHAPVVSRELFGRVQDAVREIGGRGRKANPKMPEHGNMENIYEGVIYCGLCGCPMTRGIHYREHADGGGRILETYSCYGRTKGVCGSTNNLAKLALTDILVPLIKTEFSLYLSEGTGFSEEAEIKSAAAKAQMENELKKQNICLERHKDKSTELYISYKAGEIDGERYAALKEEHEKEMSGLRANLDLMERSYKELDRKTAEYKKAVRALLRFGDDGVITRGLVSTLIRRIDVYPGRRIAVEFNYFAGMEGGRA